MIRASRPTVLRRTHARRVDHRHVNPARVVATDACLPRLPVNGRLTRNEIDLRAASVAAAARDGVVSVAHARRVIAALLYGSSIPESVATGWTADRQHRADIADRLRELLFTKVMQETVAVSRCTGSPTARVLAGGRLSCAGPRCAARRGTSGCGSGTACCRRLSPIRRHR